MQVAVSVQLKEDGMWFDTIVPVESLPLILFSGHLDGMALAAIQLMDINADEESTSVVYDFARYRDAQNPWRLK